MKKIAGIVCIFFIAVVFAENVHSFTITNDDPFQNVYTETNKKYFSKGGRHSYSFSFEIPNAFEINKATLDIDLSDDCGSIFDLFEFASIFLDGKKVAHRKEVDSWFDKDLIERHSFDVTDYLEDDSKLLVEIRWEKPLLCIGKGDFYYNESSLEIKVIQSHAPIPGAVWLLGSGLIGLIGIRRKIKKS